MWQEQHPQEEQSQPQPLFPCFLHQILYPIANTTSPAATTPTAMLTIVPATVNRFSTSCSFDVTSFLKRRHVPRFFSFLQFIAKPLAFIPRSSHFSEKPTFYSETAPFPFFLHTIAPRFRIMTYPINPAANAATMNTVHHQVRIRYTAVAVR